MNIVGTNFSKLTYDKPRVRKVEKVHPTEKDKEQTKEPKQPEPKEGSTIDVRV